MPYYHLSLSDDTEIHSIDMETYEAQVGNLISSFLNIDWDILCDECISLYEHKHDSPALSAEFATWYRTKVAVLECENPAIKVLVRSQLPGIMKNVLCDEGNYMGLGLEWTFVNNICTDSSYAISNEYILKFAQHIAHKLTELLHFQREILVLVESVLDRTQSSESLLSRYVKMRNLEQYQVLVSKYYPLLSAEFLIDKPSVAKKFYQNTNMRNSAQVLRSYFASDHIESLVLWEFDYMASQDISLRRCEYCGKYFRPFSRTSLYCDRTVSGTNKSCKQIAPITKHTRKLHTDEARILYRKVNNRFQMWVSRNKFYINARINYRDWQDKAQEQLNLVSSGQLTYEQFAAWIDKSPSEVLK